MSRTLPYWGETLCERCPTDKNHKAYYALDEQALCGYCTSRCRDTRVKLTCNPDAGDIRAAAQKAEIVAYRTAATANQQQGVPGAIRVSRIAMRGMPATLPGYIKIYPNYKHGDRTDGLGLPDLSPMNLGPVQQCGIESVNLENFYQMAKVYPCEVRDGVVKDRFYTLRDHSYRDRSGYRHKWYAPYAGADFAHRDNRTPLFSVYTDRHGRERRYNYLQSRYFYCHWYSRLAAASESFKRLHDLRQQGYNLQICGYDGYQVTNSLWYHYCDTSKPFGHELVLYAMLVLDPSEYPWVRYHRENPELYHDF